MIKLAEIANFFWLFCPSTILQPSGILASCGGPAWHWCQACLSGHRDRPGSESEGAGMVLGPTEAGLACRTVVLGLKTGSVGAA